MTRSWGRPVAVATPRNSRAISRLPKLVAVALQIIAAPQQATIAPRVRVRRTRSARTPKGSVVNRCDQRRHRHEQADVGVADRQGMPQLRRRRAHRRHVGAAQPEHAGQHEDDTRAGAAAERLGHVSLSRRDGRLGSRREPRQHTRGASSVSGHDRTPPQRGVQQKHRGTIYCGSAFPPRPSQTSRAPAPARRLIPPAGMRDPAAIHVAPGRLPALGLRSLQVGSPWILRSRGTCPSGYSRLLSRTGAWCLLRPRCSARPDGHCAEWQPGRRPAAQFCRDLHNGVIAGEQIDLYRTTI